MEHPALKEIIGLAREPDALEATIQYLAGRMSFLKQRETVLICFASHAPCSIGALMEQAVLRCGGVPVIWKDDFRWKTLLRLAFSSRAGTVIGPPLTVLGLAKLAKARGTPLKVRNVLTAGYPCLEWMREGIVRGLDCATGGCFDPGSDAVISGFSCEKSRGVHLRDQLYGVDIVDGTGSSLPEGEIGEIVVYPRSAPLLRYPTGDFARLETAPCPCGCGSPRLMDMRAGYPGNMDKDLAALAESLHSWTSILDCRLERGSYGLEMEIVTFPGEKLPRLPSAARQVIRPWNPETDVPFHYISDGAGTMEGTARS